MEEAAIREPRVALRYFDGCPNWRKAYQRLNEVMTETGYGEITVALELVETPDEAERLRFAGSPTLLLDGDDVRERGAILPARELARVVNEISDDVVGFGPIEYLLKDPSVTEVVVDGLDVSLPV